MDFDASDRKDPTEEPLRPAPIGEPSSRSPQTPIPPYGMPKDYPFAEERPKAGRPRRPWRVLWGIFTGLSVLGNVMLVVLLMGAFFMLASAGQQGGYHERVVQPGSSSSKVVVIGLEGVIDNTQPDRIAEQLRAVRKDRHVKAIILRVNSPGGGVTASDEIFD